MQSQPMLCVQDVEATSVWFQVVFGCESSHGGPNYERLTMNGKLVLQLHQISVTDHHGVIPDLDRPIDGNGIVLWFEVDDFDECVRRAIEMGAVIDLGPIRNPPDGDGGPNHRELWLRDRNGYRLVIASPDGEAGGNGNA